MDPMKTGEGMTPIAAAQDRRCFDGVTVHGTRAGATGRYPESRSSFGIAANGISGGP